jgi:hypothetical protein
LTPLRTPADAALNHRQRETLDVRSSVDSLTRLPRAMET